MSQEVLKPLFENLKHHISMENGLLVSELKKMRKAFSRSQNPLVMDKNIPTEVEPIFFHGINLCELYPGGTTTQVALAVARRLWSDEELTETQLLKKSARGRPPACPERTALLISELLTNIAFIRYLWKCSVHINTK